MIQVRKAAKRIPNKFRKPIALVKILEPFQKDIYKEFQRQKTALLNFLDKNNVHTKLIALGKKMNPSAYEKRVDPKKKKLVDKYIKRWERDVKPKNMEVVLNKWYKKISDITGNLALNDLGIQLVFNLKNGKILQEFKNRGTKITGYITEKTLNDFRDILADSYFDKGMSPYEVKDRIEGLFEETYHNRAMNIARTEIGTTQNKITFETYIQNGIDDKEWSATKDDKTRLSHIAADGQIVTIDKPFLIEEYDEKTGEPTGEIIEMMYPLDQSAPPSQICNCRCRMIPRLKGYKKPENNEAWSGGEFNEE